MRLTPIEYIGSTPRKPKKKAPIRKALFTLLFVASISAVFYKFGPTNLIAKQVTATSNYSVKSYVDANLIEDSALNNFLKASLLRTSKSVTYDPAYYEIDYPKGDIPADRGVCTDVVIRAYREIGIDLQQEVHQDILANFSSYPKNWNLSKPDTNIDHRRVPNLQAFFMRNAKSLTLSKNPSNYKPGDLVTWKLSHGAPHIGIVVPNPKNDSLKPWIVHNVGIGPQWEDALFSYEITGHYRYGID